MKPRFKKSVLLLGFAAVVSGPRMAHASQIFYGGERVETPGYTFVHYGNPVIDARVYDDFDVATQTQITALTVDFIRFDFPPPSSPAEVEIRSNVSAGSGGTSVYYASTLPASYELTGRQTLNGELEYRCTVQVPSLLLDAGRHWMMIRMDYGGLSATEGLNGIGSPIHNGNAFLYSPVGMANFVPYPSNYDVSYGVEGAPVPEPASLTALAMGVGCALRRRIPRRDRSN